MTSPSSLYFKDEIIEIKQTFTLKTLIFQQNPRNPRNPSKSKRWSNIIYIKNWYISLKYKKSKEYQGRGGGEVEGRINRVIVPLNFNKIKEIQEIQVNPKGDQTSLILKTLIFQQNPRNPRNIKEGGVVEVEGRVNSVIVPLYFNKIKKIQEIQVNPKGD